MTNPCTKCVNAKHFPKGTAGKRNYHVCKDSIDCDKIVKYKEYLQSKRIYERGEVIMDLSELLTQEFVFIYGAPKHIQFVKQQKLSTLLQLLKFKKIYKADKKAEV